MFFKTNSIQINLYSDSWFVIVSVFSILLYFKF